MSEAAIFGDVTFVNVKKLATVSQRRNVNVISRDVTFVNVRKLARVTQF